jgi:putative chitinase
MVFDPSKKSSSSPPPQSQEWEIRPTSWSAPQEAEPEVQSQPENLQAQARPTAEDLLTRLAEAADPKKASQVGVNQPSGERVSDPEKRPEKDELIPLELQEMQQPEGQMQAKLGGDTQAKSIDPISKKEEPEEEIVVTGFATLRKILRWFSGEGSPLDDVIKIAYIEPLVNIGIQPNIDVGDPPEIVQKAREFARSAIYKILGECFKNGVVNPAEVAYILATTEHETYGWFKTSEKAPNAEEGSQEERDYFNVKYAGILGNGDFASGDGYRYRGQGFVQITGKENYQKFTAKVRSSSGEMVERNLAEYTAEELEKGNSKAAQDFDMAAQTIVQGMKEGRFTNGVASLKDYFSPGKEPDFLKARAIVNGNDKAQKIADRAKIYHAKLKSFIGLK